MKADQIKKLLNGVMKNLIDSITDEEVKEILEKESFITGGCIPSMLLGEYINDFDIYLISKSAVDKVLNYYRKNYNEEEGKLLKDEKRFEPKLITDNSINLTDKVQIITRFYGSPSEVVENFDWQHIKSYYTYPDNLVLEDDVYKLVVEKDLIYTGSEYPLSSLLRTRKFIKKGWSVDDKTIVKIVMDIVEVLLKSSKISTGSGDVIDYSDKIDLVEHRLSVEELIEQLNGVDPLEMQGLIERETGEFLTISEIIDRL